MARTANVFIRVEPDVKEQAEVILNKLGLQMSNAVGLFLRQVILKQGIPFAIDLAIPHPLDMNNMTSEQIDADFEKGMESLRAGRYSTADEVAKRLQKEYGI